MQYSQQVENDFEWISFVHNNTKRQKTGKTDTQEVAIYMLEQFTAKNKIWFYSHEFVGKITQEGYFLSHRSPARASDLAIKHPELVEDRRIGKLKVYRLRLENMDLINEFINN